MKNKTQIILLMVTFFIILCSGTAIVSYLSRSFSISENVDKDGIIMQASTSDEYHYEEEIVKTEKYADSYNQGIIFSYQGKVCKIEISDNIPKLIDLNTGAAMADLPFETPRAICIDGDRGFGQVKYDIERSKLMYTLKSIDGDIIEEVELKNFDGHLSDEGEPYIYSVQATDEYIYFLASASYRLYIFTYSRSGELWMKNQGYLTYDVDEDNTLYTAVMDYKELKKVDIPKKRQLYSEKLPKSLLGAQRTSDKEMVYIMDFDGIKAYNAETRVFDHNLFKFGEESSFLVTNHSDLLEFYIDDDYTIYISHLDVYAETPTVVTYKYTRIPGKLPDRKTVLTVTAPYRDEETENIIRRYEMANKGERINYEYDYNNVVEYWASGSISKDAYTLKMLTNEIGDIVMSGALDSDPNKTFATDVFMDLSELVKQDKNYENLNKNVLKGTEVNGKLRALPVFYNVVCMEYNEALAKELGLEIDYLNLKWSDTWELANEIEKIGGGYSLFYSEGIGEGEIATMLHAQMPNLVDLENKKVDLRQQWFLDLLINWKENMSNPSYIVFDKTKQAKEKALFTLRESVLQGYQYIMIKYVDSSNIPIPVFRGEKGANRLAYGKYMYSINGKSQNKEAAWKFLSFMLEEQVQNVYRNTTGLPMNESVYDTLNKINKLGENVAAYEKIDKTQEYIRGVADNIDYVFDMGNIVVNLYNPIVKYMEGTLSLDEALTEAEKTIWVRINE